MELNFNIEEIAKLPISEQREILRILQQHEEKASLSAARTSFMGYVHRMWPQFIEGRHHREMGKIYDAVTRKELLRVCIHLPPRHTKSEFASWNFPAQYFGHHPTHKIMQISNTGELATGFGRRVRDSMESKEYAEIFEEVTVKADSRSAGRWNTNRGGDYFATGIGGAIAGRGADALIIDDPHTEAEAQAAVYNPKVYDEAYEWYRVGPRQRLQPNGAIIIVMCMTGDTPVLRPDGSTTPLKDMRVGDEVSTYDDGSLKTSWITNFRSNGVDTVFTVKTQSGIIVRANKRHPFLVLNNGIKEWIRLENLKPGMLLVRSRAVRAQREHKQSLDYVMPANRWQATIARTPDGPLDRLAIMVNGKARNAPADARSTVRDYVCHAIGRNTPLPRAPRSKGEIVESSIAMASRGNNTTPWLSSKEISVSYAKKNQISPTRAPTGAVSFVSTIATKLEKFVDFCATIATSLLGTGGIQKSLIGPQNICGFTTDPIVEITLDGRAEVFDLEVERTENFIANGLVVHNTRWAKRDLAGQVINHAIEQGAIDEWKIFNFPAIMPSGNALWPEFWSKEELEKIKRDIPLYRWLSQYQQQPTTDEGAIIKREYWKPWERDRLPEFAYILDSWDTAFTAKETGNYSARTRWGVFYFPDSNGRPLANVMLIDSYRDRLEFPALKTQVREDYRDGHPDTVLIEARGSGISLIQELSSMGMPIEQVTTGRMGVGISNDKVARANAVVDIFKSGIVWYNPSCKLNEVTIEECSDLPRGDNDDLADTVTQALKRLRDGYFVGTQHDENQIYDEDDEPASPRGRIY